MLACVYCYSPNKCLAPPCSHKRKNKMDKRNWMVRRPGRELCLVYISAQNTKAGLQDLVNQKWRFIKRLVFWCSTSQPGRPQRWQEQQKRLIALSSPTFLFAHNISWDPRKAKKNLRAVFLPAWVMKQCYCSLNRPTIVQEKQPCWFLHGETWKLWFEKYFLRPICDCDKLDFSGLKKYFSFGDLGDMLIKVDSERTSQLFMQMIRFKGTW